MAGPANQAAANVQAMQETLRGAAGSRNGSTWLISEAEAAAAITADDWTVATGDYNEYVYDDENDDPTWEGVLVTDEFDRNTVYNNRSGPMKAPYGGGNAGDQF